jgi:hypothetical protein
MTFKLIRRCGDMGCSLELTGGSTTELSATDAWHMAFVGDCDSLRPFDVGCLYRIAHSDCCRRANELHLFGLLGRLRPMDCQVVVLAYVRIERCLGESLTFFLLFFLL